MYISINLYSTARKELQLGGDCNSVFIEILKNYIINTKCNLNCGCVYRPPFMSLQHFNELLARVLGMLQREKKYVYICGDFNVNTLHKDNSGLAKQEFINLLSLSFFLPINNQAHQSYSKLFNFN